MLVCGAGIVSVVGGVESGYRVTALSAADSEANLFIDSRVYAVIASMSGATATAGPAGPTHVHSFFRLRRWCANPATISSGEI